MRGGERWAGERGEEGNEGWEMTCAEAGRDDTHAFLFRRNWRGWGIAGWDGAPCVWLPRKYWIVSVSVSSVCANRRREQLLRTGCVGGRGPSNRIPGPGLREQHNIGCKGESVRESGPEGADGGDDHQRKGREGTGLPINRSATTRDILCAAEQKGAQCGELSLTCRLFWRVAGRLFEKRAVKHSKRTTSGNQSP